MRRSGLLVMLFFVAELIAQPAAGQQPVELNNQVLFTIGSDTVTAEEYIAVYNKNRNLGEDIDPKTPLEYLDLYMNFKLKVHEAKQMGMDTSTAFLREYTSYRDQLAKPYLSDKEVAQDLIREAYDRMQYDVQAAHIMIAVPEEASEEEAEQARKKIEDLRKRVLNGEDFAALAQEYSADTYSAKNGGNLGYFTVFNMVYPFETVAYELEEGEISEPVRTRFGYHIIKKLDQRPARGTVQVAHIMVIDNTKTDVKEKQNAEQKIREIYDKLKAGESFESLAQSYSDDKNSASKGGVLPPFGINKMFPEFEEAAFNLENPGDYSQPFKTPVGWHVVKLIHRDKLPSFEEAKNEIKTKVERDARAQQSYESIIKRLKLEYGFKEYPKVKKTAFDQVDESYLKSDYKAENIADKNKVIFEFADEAYTVRDFLAYLENKQGRAQKSGSLMRELEKAYDNFSESELIAYEKSRLEDKYPEFRMLAREYYEGILLFDLTEKKVWKKSITDTTGLKNYYENHKENYRFDTRYDAVIVDAISKKMAKKAMKMLKENKTGQEIENELNMDSQLNVKIETGLFEKKDKPVLGGNIEKGFSDIRQSGNRYTFVYVKEIREPASKSLEEARGLVISDYQNHLEKEWINELKTRYEVNLNEGVLQKVVEVLETEQ